MFPIRDHNPSGRTPFVTYALVAINVVVFLSYFPSKTDFLLNFFFGWTVIGWFWALIWAVTDKPRIQYVYAAR